MKARSWIPDQPTPADLESWQLDPAWSRVLDVASHDGSTYRWHVLDSGPTLDGPPDATMVCVHGNPTWAYSWATFLRKFGTRCRVIAVDQLGMGFSERTELRRYAARVADLGDVIEALDIDPVTPFTLAAHDWGGAIAMGWAVDNADRVDGMVLCNTGIGVPAGRKSPGLIRLAAAGPLRDFVCRRTPIFVSGTTRLSGPHINAADRAAFAAPYSSATARAAVADFVGDVPLQPGGGHPSDSPLAEVAAKLGAITAPVLLAWGAADPVFNDDFAADLADRIPNTSMQRFPSASHLVMAEADVAAVVDDWLSDLVGGLAAAADIADIPAPAAGSDRAKPLWAALDERRADTSIAFADMASGQSITWADFAERVDGVAAQLADRGMRPGEHVAMLTPPGVDLVVAVYGVWRAGGVTVVADRGLGLRGLGRAVRSTRPSWVVGPSRALRAAKTLRWAPRAEHVDVDALMAKAIAGSDPLATEPAADDLAAILFTSGATGPAKGVRYLHRQLAAQRDALAATYKITADDSLVAAFAPFALYGPALGISTVLPDCDVTKPGKLTAVALDAACRRLDATLAFASPAALANVLATAGPVSDGLDGLRGLRTVMSAGAPVPAETLTALSSLVPNASLHTPYGMTEVLPVADVNLEGINAASGGDPIGGVCVGRPVPGATVEILPLGFDPAAPPAAMPTGEMGEIVISTPWVSDGYHGLWATERAARLQRGDGKVWHRSGDVGHLDDSGRLWVEGRAVHNIDSAAGVITSVPVERLVETSLDLARVAAVGVGPAGCQQLVVVVEDLHGVEGLASTDLTARVRSVVKQPVAAVLSRRALPVDIRHNAKIDRTAVAGWADDVLAGRSTRRFRRG